MRPIETGKRREGTQRTVGWRLACGIWFGLGWTAFAQSDELIGLQGGQANLALSREKKGCVVSFRSPAWPARCGRQSGRLARRGRPLQAVGAEAALVRDAVRTARGPAGLAQGGRGHGALQPRMARRTGTHRAPHQKHGRARGTSSPRRCQADLHEPLALRPDRQPEGGKSVWRQRRPQGLWRRRASARGNGSSRMGRFQHAHGGHQPGLAGQTACFHAGRS